MYTVLANTTSLVIRLEGPTRAPTTPITMPSSMPSPWRRSRPLRTRMGTVCLTLGSSSISRIFPKPEAGTPITMGSQTPRNSPLAQIRPRLIPMATASMMARGKDL